MTVSKVPAEVKVTIFRLLCFFSGFENSWMATYHMAMDNRAIIKMNIAMSSFFQIIKFLAVFVYKTGENFDFSIKVVKNIIAYISWYKNYFPNLV